MTKREEPTWAAEIRKLHGDYAAITTKYAPSRIAAVGADPIAAVASDSPSLVRLDGTYGTGAARQWLFLLIQSTLKTLGVGGDRMSDLQIVHLADVIRSSYPYVSMAEMMLFFFRFECGQYERFYGDASYFLAVTTSLRAFMEERAYWIDKAERQKREKEKQQERKEFLCTYAQRIRMNKSEDKEVVEKQAKSILYMNAHYPFSEAQKKENIEAFKCNYGNTPEEYLKQEKNDKK